MKIMCHSKTHLQNIRTNRKQQTIPHLNVMIESMSILRRHDRVPVDLTTSWSSPPWSYDVMIESALILRRRDRVRLDPTTLWSSPCRSYDVMFESALILRRRDRVTRQTQLGMEQSRPAQLLCRKRSQLQPLAVISKDTDRREVNNPVVFIATVLN